MADMKMALSLLEHMLITFLGRDKTDSNMTSVVAGAFSEEAVKRVGNHSATMFEHGFCCTRAETWEEKG